LQDHDAGNFSLPIQFDLQGNDAQGACREKEIRDGVPRIVASRNTTQKNNTATPPPPPDAPKLGKREGRKRKDEKDEWEKLGRRANKPRGEPMIQKLGRKKRKGVHRRIWVLPVQERPGITTLMK